MRAEICIAMRTGTPEEVVTTYAIYYYIGTGIQHGLTAEGALAS